VGSGSIWPALWGVAAALALWLAPELWALARGVRGMGPGALRSALKAGRHLIVLDVRSDREFAAGHIPGAKHLPLDRLREGLPLLEGMKGSDVVCVCASGKRSALAAVRLKRAGFPVVYNLWGGMLLWRGDDGTAS
jgi:rhodanese-related sulfurtransferase